MYKKTNSNKCCYRDNLHFDITCNQIQKKEKILKCPINIRSLFPSCRSRSRSPSCSRSRSRSLSS